MIIVLVEGDQVFADQEIVGQRDFVYRSGAWPQVTHLIAHLKRAGFHAHHFGNDVRYNRCGRGAARRGARLKRYKQNRAGRDSDQDKGSLAHRENLLVYRWDAVIIGKCGRLIRYVTFVALHMVQHE